ncbi:MAG: hypothetical protein N4A36_00880, partial [Candidatus Gracilibacteria bacterium]|nr:hypothetical protein [Candidatus Gracilibacteria bacterium]
GSISTHAGVDLLRIEEAAQAIRDEYENMAQNGITENELERAKSFLKGKITLRMEDSEELASMIASQITHLGYAKRIKSLFHKIEKVSKKEVEDLARELFVPANLHMSLIGPFGEKRDALLKIIQGKDIIK